MLRIIIFVFITFLIFANNPSNAAETSAEQAKEILRTNDFDKDGKLSKEEVDLSFRLRRFKRVDTNSDGFLDEAELTQSYERAAQARVQNEQNKSPIDKIFNKVSSPGDSNQRYTVEPGDSLYSIAKKYNVAVEDLMQINGINDETKVPINKVLIIPVSDKTN